MNKIYAEDAIRYVVSNKKLTNGDLAALRRMDPKGGYPAAFWKIKAAFLPSVSEDTMTTNRIAQALRTAAILRDMQGETVLGTHLAANDFSEIRFSRLLRARGDGIFDVVRTTALFLKSKSKSFRVDQLINIILDPSEEYRQQIASQFYRRSEINQ